MLLHGNNVTMIYYTNNISVIDFSFLIFPSVESFARACVCVFTVNYFRYIVYYKCWLMM